jgi:hypothetical protein
MATRSESSDFGVVTEVPLARLHCWPGNPRRISPVDFENLQQSLAADRAMLWARPLIALLDGKSPVRESAL